MGSEYQKISRVSPGRARMLPKEVCYQCIWTVRDMKRLSDLVALDTYEHGENEIVLYDTGDSRATREGVMLRAAHVLDCIHAAAESVPEEYREGILENIIERKEFDVSAHMNTWQKWKRIFLYELAGNLMLI